MVRKTQTDWENEFAPKVKAAIGNGLHQPEDAWIALTDGGVAISAEDDGFGPGYIYIRRMTPDNPEYIPARIRTGRREDMRDRLCVSVRPMAKDVKGVAWEVIEYGVAAYEQFQGQSPPRGIGVHDHQTDTGGGLLNAAAIGSGTLDDARLSANVMLLDGVQTVTGAKTFGTGDLIADTADLNTPDIDGGTLDGATINSSSIGQTTPAAGRFTAMALNAATELTIASGAVTVTQSYHRIDTEADAATDDLATINGGGDTLNRVILRAETGSRTVVIKTSGNITTHDGADITLDETSRVIELVYDGTLTKWQVIGVGNSSSTVAATNVTYTPSTPSEWTDPDPTTVQEALDAVRSDLAAVEGLVDGGAPDNANYIVGVASAGLSDETVIPGLRGSPDIAGAAGGGISEEYDSSSTGLTWNSAPNTVDSNSTLLSHLYIKTTDTTEYIGTRSWSPAGAFDARVKLSFILNSVSASSGGAGFHIGSSSNTSRVLMQLVRTTGSTFVIRRYTYSGGSYTVLGTDVNWAPSDIYFRITRDGSNNVSFWYSQDGLGWRLITTTSFTFTVDNIGYRVGNNENSDVEIYSDWLRTNV